MSFKCEVCEKVQPVGTKPVKVVTEIRNVTYPHVKTYDGKIKIPIGFEPVKEVTTCPDCSIKIKDLPVEVVGQKVIKEEENDG